MVWGGYGIIGGWQRNGARYDPATDVWTATSLDHAPSERADHTAVADGSLMVVWAGEDDSGRLATGAVYRPNTPLFSDGFESGDTGAWSTAVGSLPAGGGR